MIPGAAARKVRFAGRGKGKSGGYRVITFYSGARLPVFLLAVFGKGAKVDLTPAERNERRRELAGLVEDYRRGVSLYVPAGEKILGSVRNLRAAVRSRRSPRPRSDEVDVRAIRRKLGMSQRQFAASFGFGLDAVQNWEQGRRRPEGARARLSEGDRARAGRGARALAA